MKQTALLSQLFI